jgi:hypothetical protein
MFDPVELGRRTLALAQGVAGLRGDDVLLASFPRSGNTWVRFFLCHLADVLDGRREETGFDRVNAIMPEFGRSNLLRPWSNQGLARFVKTHAPYNPVFRGHRAVLVVRDPRDVLLSFHRYESHRLRRRVPADLAAHLRHPRFGFEGWFRHTRAWLPHATVVVRYEELRRDDLAELGRMLVALGQRVPDEAVALAAERSRLERIREAERTGGAGHSSEFGTGFAFTPEGRAGAGRDALSQADHALYQDLKRRYGLDLY